MPKFYGMENELQNTLIHLNYDVELIESKSLLFDYHGTKSKFRFLRKIYFNLFSPDKRFIKNSLNRIENLRFDILFSINGHSICPYLFNKFKKYNPKLRSILFLWDSSSMYSWKSELKYFDKVFTFDPVDSVKFKIEYKPNFYIKAPKYIEEEKKHDLFFAGKFNPYRSSLFDPIFESAVRSGVNFYLRLWAGYRILFHNKFIYRLLICLRITGSWVNDYITNFEAVEGILKRNLISSNAVSFQEVQQHMICSNVILDIPFPGQSGYSHRLIEALANGKKAITSNVSIKSEKFYNPDQIHLIDPLDPKIDFEWVQDRVLFPVNDYIKDLELSMWLKTILNVEISR